MAASEINLYSDTVTKPTPGMRQAIANAEVGDDMNGEDPTVNRLESMICELLQKEAAVFACSGTQSNQMGVRVHCSPGDELLIEENGHIACFEGGAPAALSGVMCRTIRGRYGMLDIPDLEGRVRAENQHLCVTRLLCLENTTNGGGGRAWPVEQLHRVCDWAHANGLKTHLDGARLFNAATASRTSVRELCSGFDTVSICFSKGLGCPMGSVLVGSAADIHKARRIRKLMGGAMRQSGMMAAAAVYALEHHVERLADDHASAKAFAEAVARIEGITIDLSGVETNLVFFDLDPKFGGATQLAHALRERGVRIGAMGPRTLRACTHLDVNREQALQAVDAIRDCLKAGISHYPGSKFGPFARA